jgi:signal transduction histidine kinase
MRPEWVNTWAPRLSVALALIVVMAVAAIAFVGYRATREWKLSGLRLVERRAEESANLLVTALARDMRGVQASVLASRDDTPFTTGPLSDTRDQVASAFARYPYPESFFGWRAEPTPDVVFFNRANRPPPWVRPYLETSRYPVALVRDPSVAAPLIARIQADIDAGRQYSIFETELAGQAYQVVTRLQYDEQGDGFESAFGYTVNLDWVTRSYFSEIVAQVSGIGNAGQTLDLAVLDGRGRAITGTTSDLPATSRSFPLLFFDPATIAVDPPPDLKVRKWEVQVSAARDPTLAWATRSADWALLVAVAAAFALSLSLVFTVHIVRVNARLAEMRADFVSTVTHELRTPLATIRAVGDTLVRGRVTGPEAVGEYAQMLVQEAKRLTRLVDNLLAYARVTDITEVYAFERQVPADLIEDVLRGFQHQLADGGFEVVAQAADADELRQADRTSMRLALDNVVDNAIRYAGERRWIGISAATVDNCVAIEVRDRGIGIPAEDLPQIQKKFVRGKLASPGGNGLGLAIVSRIVKDHGGRFDIASTIGLGTIVRLQLPALEG